MLHGFRHFPRNNNDWTGYAPFFNNLQSPTVKSLSAGKDHLGVFDSQRSPGMHDAPCRARGMRHSPQKRVPSGSWHWDYGLVGLTTMFCVGMTFTPYGPLPASVLQD